MRNQSSFTTTTTEAFAQLRAFTNRIFASFREPVSTEDLYVSSLCMIPIYRFLRSHLRVDFTNSTLTGFRNREF